MPDLSLPRLTQRHSFPQSPQFSSPLRYATSSEKGVWSELGGTPGSELPQRTKTSTSKSSLMFEEQKKGSAHVRDSRSSSQGARVRVLHVIPGLADRTGGP